MSLIGTRVEIPAFSDYWMKGDRYGVIAKANHDAVADDVLTTVRLDKSGARRPFLLSDLRRVTA